MKSVVNNLKTPPNKSPGPLLFKNIYFYYVKASVDKDTVNRRRSQNRSIYFFSIFMVPTSDSDSGVAA